MIAYNGFLIEKDETIETEVYYIKRADGRRFQGIDGQYLYIDSQQDKLENVKEYIDYLQEN